MKVLVTGALHPGSHGRYMLHALHDLGHLADGYDYRAAAYGRNYDLPRGPWRRRLRRAWRGLAARGAEEAARQSLLQQVRDGAYDAVVVSKGEIFPPAFLDELARHSLLATWHTDSPTWVRYSTPRIVDSIPCYHVVAVFDEHYLPELQRLGARRTLHLPLAYDPRVHRPAELTAEERRTWGSPVCFVGDWKGARREAWLLPLVELGLAIWGRGWDRASPALAGCWSGRPALGPEAAKVYAASTVAVNVHEIHSVTAPNMRCFEASACAAPLVSDAVARLADYLEPGREILVAEDPRAMAGLIAGCLARPEETAAMGRRARARVDGVHSYAARMERLVGVLEEVRGARSAERRCA